MDEWNLWPQFGPNQAAAEAWLNTHLENFVKEEDIAAVAAAGATHIRVPLPHYILGKDEDVDAQNWVVGQRWQAFQRLVRWARRHNLQVWPDIHSAPGSQNGFDNSGHQSSHITCVHWSRNPSHVKRSIEALQQITAQMRAENMQDVVTGFGLLNEPFKDCDRGVYMDYIEQGLDIVRHNLGHETYVYVSDMFEPQALNDGHWWQNNATRYNHTILDTHYYHVFAGNTRGFSPRQHIAMTCQNEYHVDPPHSKPKDVEGGVATCCWQDPPKNTIPSTQVQRMVGEWSAALDVLPVDKLFQMMDSIAANGTVIEFDRTLSADRAALVLRFAQAQMVTYEAADKGIGQGWFYWTLKMEGGAFAEWDFLRGVREGWLPHIPPPETASTELFGTCYDLLWRTDDNMTVIHEYPADPRDATDPWMGVPVDDDVILTHGQSLLIPEDERHHHGSGYYERSLWVHVVGMAALVALALYLWKQVRNGSGCLRKKGYTEVPSMDV